MTDTARRLTTSRECHNQNKSQHHKGPIGVRSNDSMCTCRERLVLSPPWRLCLAPSLCRLSLLKPQAACLLLLPVCGGYL